MTARIAAVGLAASNMAHSIAALGPVLDRYEAFGLDLVELPLYSLDVMIAGRVLPDGLRAMCDACADRPFGFTIHSALSSNFMDRERIVMQRAVCRAAMDVAVALGADRVVHHGGKTRSWRIADIAADEAFQAEHLHAAGEEARERGITLCVETMFRCEPDIWTATPSRLARQLADIDHPNVRATIDFSHGAQRMESTGEDFMAEIAALAPYGAHLHMHDSFGSIGHGPFKTRGEQRMFGLGDVHLPPGDGALDWQALSRLPYPAGATLMLETPEHYPGAQEKSVAAARAFAARSGGAA